MPWGRAGRWGWGEAARGFHGCGCGLAKNFFKLKKEDSELFVRVTTSIIIDVRNNTYSVEC